MTQTDSGADPYIERFHTVLVKIETATHAAEQGQVLNLAALEAEAAQLCQAISNAPTDIATRVQPLMGDIISKLDHLAAVLSDLTHQHKG